MGSGGIVPRILNLGTGWRWVVSFTLRPLYARKNSRCLWIGCWMGPRASLYAVTKRKASCPIPTGNRTLVVQSAAQSLYWLSYPGSLPLYIYKLVISACFVFISTHNLAGANKGPWGRALTGPHVCHVVCRFIKWRYFATFYELNELRGPYQDTYQEDTACVCGTTTTIMCVTGYRPYNKYRHTPLISLCAVWTDVQQVEGGGLVGRCHHAESPKLINSMEQDPSWEANSYSASQ
jgi:hypothetical protein